MQSCRAILLVFLGLSVGMGDQIAAGLEPSSLAEFPVQFAAPPVSRSCLTQLQSQMASILAQSPLLRSHWGILVQGPKGEPYFAHNSEQFFTPASNAKLFVTAAALQHLGPNFRIPTRIYQRPGNAQQVELVIQGQGDPTITDEQLQQLAQQLAQQGIQRIDRLWADASAIQGPIYQGTWALEDVTGGEITPLTGLIVNRNASVLRASPQALGQPLQLQWQAAADAQRWRVENRTLTVASTAPEFVEMQIDASSRQLTVYAELRAGSDPEMIEVPVSNPTMNFLERFQQALTQQGIAVQSVATVSDPAPVDWAKTYQDSSAIVATVYSPKLQDLVTEINQQSDNFYAEALLRVLGSQAESSTPSATTSLASSSAERGLTVVRQTLTALGVDPAGYHLVDGSGLSRQNLVSPVAIVQLLQGMAQTANAKIFQSALAEAGKSGTLSSRFRETEAAGKVWGKTGTLTGVAALSGLALTSESTPLSFSILVNQSEQERPVLIKAIDQMVLSFVRLGRCS